MEKDNIKGDINEAFEKAKDEVKEAAERVEKKARTFASEAKQAFDEAKGKAGDFAQEAGDATKGFREEAKTAYERSTGSNKKVLSGVLAILFGGFGVHKFVLGYYKEGVLLLAITVVLNIFSFSFLGWLVWVFTFIEGIIYLTKSDEEFYNTYQLGKKPWF